MNTKKDESEKMISCPECEKKLPENDLRGQIRHMESMHPKSKVVEERLRGINRR